MGYNAKSAVLLILVLGSFAGIVSLTLETVTGAFESPGTPLLKSETFRTAETPFRGWSLPQVVALVMFALAVMAFGAITLVLRNRLAGLASAACLLVLLGLVLFTPIGRYGAGAQQVGAAAPNDRFIALESGVLYDTQGKLPFGAVAQFRESFPDDGPQNIQPDFQTTADLRASQVSSSTPLFKVSGTGQGTYLRQSVLNDYQDGVWSHEPQGEYDQRFDYASTLRISGPSGRDSGQTLKIRVIPITQLPPGNIIATSDIRLIDFPDPLFYSSGQSAFFSPNSHALAYSFEIVPQQISANDLTEAQVFHTQDSISRSQAVSPNVRDLAKEVTESLSPPFLQIKALERHLRASYEYDPDPEPAPQGEDPVEWFLFESRSGTALHFNSALALMARGLGIQTRIVAGWVAGTSEGQQTIYGDMSHAWTEAQLVINGRTIWLEFDASTNDGPRERAGDISPPGPEVQVISATPSPNASSGSGAPGLGELSVGSAVDDISGPSQVPDGAPPPDLEPFIGPQEPPTGDAAFDAGGGDITGLPVAEGLDGGIPGDLSNLGGAESGPGSAGTSGSEPSGGESDGVDASSEVGSDEGLGSETGAEGSGSSVVSLENGLQLDLDQGGISGVSLGVKGPVQLTDQAAFQLRGAAGVSKLRLVTGETYTGSSWLPADVKPALSIEPGQRLPIPAIRTATDYAATDVDVTPILAMGPGPVPVSLYTIGLDGLEGARFHPHSLSVEVPDSIDSGYSWLAATPVIRPHVLRTKSAAVPSEALLQLPESPPQRVLDLAIKITQGKGNDYDKLEAIRQHLLQNYTYDLDNDAAPPGSDAVDFFLFDDKRGICTTFSSAMVVMARSLGIPARVVAGWSVSPVRALQEVRTSQAHQWVEVPFQDVGWVTFDPTPGGAPTRTEFPEANAALPDVEPESDETGGETAETGAGELGQGESSTAASAIEEGAEGEGTEESGQATTESGDVGEAGVGTGGTGGSGDGPAISESGSGGTDGSDGSGSLTPLENGMSLDLAAGILVSPNAGLTPQGSSRQASRPANLPVLQVTGASNTRYLRQGVSIDYQGGHWTYSPEADLIWDYVFPPDEVDADINRDRAAALGPVDAYYLGAPDIGNATAVDIVVKPLLAVADGSPLPTSLYLSGISLPGTVDGATNIFNTALGLKANDVYGWSAKSYGFEAETLAAAAPVQDPRYFHLPTSLPSRIRELAVQVTSGASSPYEKAKALEVFLKTEYTYAFIQDDPTYVPMPAGRDPVDWFLFDHPVGTCGNFSSSFVLMARSIGLPARIVTGWAVAPISEKQIVKTGQAHQWAEVAFEDVGWITFEPTAAGGAPDRVPQPSSPSQDGESPGEFDESGGDAGGQGGTTTPPIPPRLEETITDITSMSSSRVLKGTQVLVQGTVTDSRGSPIAGMDVEIRLSETKEEEGIKMSQGRSANGVFAITMVIGPDTPAGAYQVLAHSLGLTAGNVQFTESWSDPPIVVYTPTKITIGALPPTIYAGEPVTIEGSLTEQVGGQPIGGAALSVQQDGLGIGNVVTRDSGRFSTQLLFTSRGNHNLRLIYGGLEFYEPLTVQQQLAVWMKTTLGLQTPQRAIVDQPSLLAGALIDASGTPVRGHAIILSDGDTVLGTVTTDVTGIFELPVTFTTPGIHTIQARFERADFYEESAAQGEVPVFMPTSLTVSPPAGTEVRVSEPVDLQGTLRDLRGQGLGQRTLTFKENGQTIVALGTSDEGVAGFSWTPVDWGERLITVEFPGEGFYLPSKSEVLLSSFMPTTLVFLDPPAEGDVGSPIPLLLKLRDILEQPLLGGDIAVLENGQPALTGTADAQGRTLFSYAPYEGGDYHLTARYEGGGFFLPSEAHLDLKVFLPTTLRILEPTDGPDSRQISLIPFGVAGDLTDIHDRPIPGQEVIVSLDGAADSQETATKASGEFAGNIEPRSPGERTLYASFPGAGFFRPSEDEITVPVFMPVVLDPVVPDRATVGVPAEIGVSVRDLLQDPVGSGGISAELDSKQLASGQVNRQGGVLLAVPLEQQGDTQLTLQYEPAEHYLPQSASVSLPVFLGTKLTLDTPESAKVGDLLQLSGTLLDAKDRPIPAREVKLYESDVFLTEIVTGDTGTFSTEMTPQTFGLRQISARFAEQDFFESASTSLSIPVFVDILVTVTLADMADAGTPTELVVRVSDESGGAVPAGLVEISGAGVQPVTFAVADGVAQGKVILDQGGPVRLVASLQPVDFYLAGQTSQQVQVDMPTRIIMDRLPEPGVYESFDVSGRLVDFFGRGLPGQRIVFGLPNGSPGPKVATAEDGRFTVPLNFKSPGESSLDIRFPRNGVFKESSAEAIVTVLPVILRLAPPSHLTRGQENEVAGRISRGEEPLAGETVELSLDGRSFRSGQSDALGEFRINVVPGPLTSLAPHQLTAVISRVQLSESWDIPVKAATSLRATAPPSAHNGSRVDLASVLMDDQNNPLTGETLTLNGQLAGRTDEVGELVVEHTVPEDALPEGWDEIQYTLALGYSGTDFYLPAEASVSLEITPPPPILLIGLLSAAGLALVGGPSTAYLVARHRRRSMLRWPSEVADSYDIDQLLNQSGSAFGSKLPTTVFVTANGQVIAEEIRLVTGDVLSLDVAVREDEGQPENPSLVAPVFFQQGDQPATVTQGKEGRIHLEVSFPDKGRQMLRAIFPGSKEYLPSIAQVQVAVQAPTELRVRCRDMPSAPDGRAICPMGESLGLLLELRDAKGETVTGQVAIRVDGDEVPGLDVTGAETPFDLRGAGYGTHRLEAEFRGDDLHLPSGGDLSFVVPTPTTVTIGTPPTRRPAAPVDGEEVLVWRRDESLPCTLSVQDINNHPLSVTATVDVDGVGREESIDSGGGTLVPVIIREPGLHRVTITYAGNADYLPSSAQILVKIPKPTRLGIDLPDLRRDIPRVWGIGDPLSIAVALAGLDGDPVDRPVRLEGPALSLELTLDQGAGHATVTYDKLQNVTITARFSGDEDFEESQASASVQVLNLGEEIVRVYQGFVTWTKDRLAPLPIDATARERGNALVQVVDSPAAGAGREITRLFEEADYSIHPISIDHYASMYLAARSLGIEQQPGEDHS